MRHLSCLLLSFLAIAACVHAASNHSLKACSFPDAAGATERMGRAVQFQTVSERAKTADGKDFRELNDWLATAYPSVWKELRVEQVGEGQLSLLLTWRGSHPDLRPVLFISHTDVVPVDNNTLKEWVHPPFSGAVADGFVWGRGTQDVKIGVVSLLEAAAALLKEGFKPKRTLLFAFGHDEEIGGANGNSQISALLASRNITLEMVVDEGVGVSMDGLAPFTTQPLAVVGTGDKRLQTVQVNLRSEGGHSSNPPINSNTIGDKLGRLLTAVGKNPPPARLVPPTTDFLQAMQPLAAGWLSAILQGVNQFRPLHNVTASALARANSEAAALVRSTAVVTRVNAGIADNVIPETATVKINFRLLPGDTPDTALQQVKKWLGKDANTSEVSLVKTGVPPTPMPVANASGPHFAIMKAALQQNWKVEGQDKPVNVVPFLLPAATDSRHFAKLSPNGALRFTPGTFSKAGQELASIHAVNEKVSVKDYICGLGTYRELLRRFGEYLGGSADKESTVKKQQTESSATKKP